MNFSVDWPPVWTEEDVAEAKRRLASDEPRLTIAQILEYLLSLDRKRQTD